jgi:uncharacterized membrane protein
MHQPSLEHHDQLVPAVSAKPFRIVSVDQLRGLVMILMALDHTRDYFSGLPFPPEDLTHTWAALFLTRVITHFCAPVFFLLAGAGAYLSVARGRSLPQVSRFFWTRGLWLIFLELTILRFAWDFNFASVPLVQVIWALGWSMIAMALIVRLPVQWIGALGVTVIVFHHLLDFITPGVLGGFSGVWTFLHVPGVVAVTPQIKFLVAYPLIPWVGVMAAGYSLGAIIQRPDRKNWLLGLGATLTIAFFVLRTLNFYGNSDAAFPSFFPWSEGPWKPQPTLTLTIIAFFDTLKYPPSLDYLLMTLGPALIVLACLSGLNSERGPLGILLVFGRVPLFYYVFHVFLVHTLAILVGWLFHQPVAWLWQGTFVLQRPPAGYGHDLWFVYLMWFLVLLILYRPCKWYMTFKSERRTWAWLSYL